MWYLKYDFNFCGAVLTKHKQISDPDFSEHSNLVMTKKDFPRERALKLAEQLKLKIDPSIKPHNFRLVWNEIFPTDNNSKTKQIE